MVIAPFGKVQFIDFFVGDVLTSIVKTLNDMEYALCYYATGDFLSHTPTICIEPNLLSICAKELKSHAILTFFLKKK